MPDWIRALGMAGVLCLPLARCLCQDDPDANRYSSLAHYRLAEEFFQKKNYQSAADEFREALNGDLEPKWTQMMSHIRLGEIFDLSGQHDRAVNEFREAQQARGPLTIALPASEPIQRREPEYTGEARLAELEGTVVLIGAIGEDGFAHDLEVMEPLGLGLDEKAVEAVKQWHFAPGANQATARGTTQIAVDFRLSSHQSRWHLIQVQFDSPPGTARPVFVSAPYPIGAGLGPEAMEEGRLIVAMGRLAAAKLTFEVDEHGVPARFQIPGASDPIWGSEATAVVGQWRFTPGTKNGIAVPVPCSLELVWGERELTSDLQRQLHDVLTAR